MLMCDGYMRKDGSGRLTGLALDWPWSSGGGKRIIMR